MPMHKVLPKLAVYPSWILYMFVKILHFRRKITGMTQISAPCFLAMFVHMLSCQQWRLKSICKKLCLATLKQGGSSFRASPWGREGHSFIPELASTSLSCIFIVITINAQENIWTTVFYKRKNKVFPHLISFI